MNNLLVFALVGVFASVALLTGTVATMVLSRTATERRRLREVMRKPREAVLQELMPLSSDAASGPWQQVAKLLPRSSKDLNRLRQRMSRAGIRHPAAPIVYSILELGMPIVVGAAALLLFQPPLAWFAAGAGAIIGFFVPGLFLERRMSKRRREIENGLPDALDLLIVCIEAGSGIDQAIMKTGEELAISYPALAEEFRMMNAEIRAGKPRLDAFKQLAARTKVDDVRALVSMLIQTDRFGTSIGQALRTHAESSRTKRRQLAEEAAAKIGVKLVFPLVLFFFPALYVVVLGPAVIQFLRNFRQ